MNFYVTEVTYRSKLVKHFVDKIDRVTIRRTNERAFSFELNKKLTLTDKDNWITRNSLTFESYRRFISVLLHDRVGRYKGDGCERIGRCASTVDECQEIRSNPVNTSSTYLYVGVMLSVPS